MNKLSVMKLGLVLIASIGLFACGGGGGGSAPETTGSRNIGGGGVKGPLANAIVTVYRFDASQTGFKGAVAATATTDAAAAISGLSLPFPVSPPYIIEFTSDAGTTDVTTGMVPVIGSMRSVITQSLLDTGEQVYATPLTTMAVDIAIANSTPTTSAAQFELALAAAASDVVSTLGFGMSGDIDIFDQPPLVDNTTVTTANQSSVAAYRSAVEALTAVVFEMQQQSGVDSVDALMAELSGDLADGSIDGMVSGVQSEVFTSTTLDVLDQDPSTLPIPNTAFTVADVQTILVSETATTGSTTSTTQLNTGGSITTTAKPAVTNPDIDGDLVLNANDAFPLDINESVDSDGDGIGDNADPDDDNNGILDVDEGVTAAPTTDDTDGDGFNDIADNCPLIFNPSQTNSDVDADGDACDSDDDNDGTADTADAFPLNAAEQSDNDRDGTGDNADTDDDNDGLLDSAEDAAAADPDADGIINRFDTDSDNDGALDKSDFAPYDNTIRLNRAPVTSNSSVTVNEDNAVPFVLAVIDDDVPTGVALTYTLGSPSNGVLSGTAPNLTYTPSAEFSGTDSFTFTATDGAPKISNTSTVTITVNAVNDPPVIDQAGPLAIGMSEDSTPTSFVPPTVSATDVDSATLSWSGSVAANGTAIVSGTGASPTIGYIPNANFNGIDSFEVTVSDGDGGSDTITIDVTVSAQNDAPVIAQTGPLAVSMDEDGAPGGFMAPAISATDVDSATLTWTGTAASNGSASVSGVGASPTITYTPTADFSGDDSFDVSVSDGNGGSATITIDVTVNAQNDAPEIAQTGPLAVSMDEDGAPSGFMAPTISATDVDSATLTWTGTAASNGSASVSGTGASPTITYTPATDFSGDDSFDVSVSDGNGGSATITIDVTVNAQNDAPEIAQTGPLAVSMDEDGAPSGFMAPTISAIDVDSATLTWTGTAASNGSASVSGTGASPTITYAPTANFSGDDSFDVSVSDGDGGSATITINVTVSAQNDAPVADDDTVALMPAEVSDITSQLLANDSDIEGDSLTVISVTTASAGTVSLSGGAVTFDATGLVNGNSASFTYTLSDGALSDSATVTVNITSNQAPVANAGVLSVDEDSSGNTGSLTATDPESDAITAFAISTPAANGTATITDSVSGAYSYTPNADFSGEDSFSFTASDATGTSAPASITITVNPFNDAPIAVNDSDSTDEDTLVTTINVLINDTDADGDSLSVSSADISSAEGGVVVNNSNGTFDYTPAGDFFGDDSFSYSVTDGVETAVGTVTITVAPINDAPVANDDSESTSINTSFTTANVLLNDSDVDGDALSVVAGNPTAANGSVVNNDNGTFVYTPNLDYVGSDSFTYSVTDSVLTAQATVNITVSPAGDVATMSILLDPAQGGGVGALEAETYGLAELYTWKDLYDPISATLSFDDTIYDYATQSFVPDSDTDDELWLTSAGTWELAAQVLPVLIADNGDGSMTVSVRNQGDTEEVARFRISARTLDISGQLQSDYLPPEWVAQLNDSSAVFTAGALALSSYDFEPLINDYTISFETWCETEDPVRFSALNGNCNGVALDESNGIYATTLDQVISSSAWVDPDNGTTDGLIAIRVSFDEFTNRQLLAELLSNGDVNYYVQDYSSADPVAGVSLVLVDMNGWVRDATVNSVDMIRHTVPASLQASFPELTDLNGLFVVQDGAVRGGLQELIGVVSSEVDQTMNGVAMDQVMANFVPPVSLVGTWIPTAAQNDPNDFLSLSFYADGTYTHAEVDFDDATETSGMEWGTYSRGVDGLLTVTQTFDNNGDTGLTDFVAGPAAVYADVVGNILTLSIDETGNGFIDVTIEFDRVSSSVLSGSWRPTVAQNDPNDFLSLIFFDNGTYTHMEIDFSDVTETSGMEWGTYSVDSVTGQLTATQLFDANGSTGLTDFAGNFAPFAYVDTVGDILTTSIDEDGDSIIDTTINFDRSDISGGTSSGGRLPCNYESGWNDLADGGLGAPINPNSFADYEGSLASCGTAQSFTPADIEGDTLNDGDGETTSFDPLAGAAGTELDPGTGAFSDPEGSFNMIWYVEAATCVNCTHSYLVIVSDDTLNPGIFPPGFSIRQTTALTGVVGTLGVAGAIYTLHHYSEQSNYSDADRATGADGEIWYWDDTLQ